MAKLDRIILINAAGFDYLEFPVGGHGQVIGVNGHGKSTLLRTVLFFYLGTNEKAPYALHETKSDFVSHYLGDPPSYLIYEVARGNGQPPYHIAVTRPSGRIQFQFVDAPFLKEYYVNGSFVQTMDNVLRRLREARCPHDSLTSYEEFVRRLYGIAPSPYSVFRPAQRTSGQVSILPRIISGLFTVSQLDADKLKAALTCGVKEDALNTELDLLSLKGQLENFRRVNRAVKTFIRCEDDALQLVDVAEQFEVAKAERQRAIEDLVRMAKQLPQRSRELEEAQTALQTEQTLANEQYQREKTVLDDVIRKLGEAIAVLTDKINKGEEVQRDYGKHQIDKKAAELETLPKLQEDKRQADEEYTALTTKFDDENQRKVRLLANVQQGWTEFSRQFEQRRAEAERSLAQSLEGLNGELNTALSTLDEEQQRAKNSLNVRQVGLDFSRGKLNEEFKAWADTSEPDELKKGRRTLEEKRNKQRAENARLQGLRADVALQKEQRDRAREKIDQGAEAERVVWQAKVKESQAKRDIAAAELEKFDESVVRYFQLNSPNTWEDAAKTLARETLFHPASELDAKPTKHAAKSVWGVELSTEKLVLSPDGFDRGALESRLEDLRKALGNDNDQLSSVQQRYISAVDAFEKQAIDAQKAHQSQIDSCADLCRSLGTEADQLENRVITLDSQFKAHKTEWRTRLETRDTELKGEEKQLRIDQSSSENQFQARKQRLDADFNDRKKQLTKARDERLATIAEEETQAAQKRDDERQRIEKAFQESLTKQGVNEKLIQKVKTRADELNTTITRVSGYAGQVSEFQGLKREFVDALDSIRSQHRINKESHESESNRLTVLVDRHTKGTNAFKLRQNELEGHGNELRQDENTVKRFRDDRRFLLEWGLLYDAKLEPAPFYRAGAAREFGTQAETAHQNREDIDARGNKNARTFLNHFDAETLERKVLGFSPIHEHFNWYIFVGAELRPFVNGRGIQGMKQIQTQEFEQLIRNISGKNADFQEGIRQVRQTAALVQANLEKNNFVDVLDSIELKVERVDNSLTQILTELESFAGLTFSSDRDLFGKRADRDQIDKAIDTFSRLVKEIDNYRDKRLRLTDYFDFLIRVQENGHDMGWKRSLDHIGSTGTDYLVKMLIYLSLIEVYRERAIDARNGSTVHCVLDETGVLAPKYIRRILEYAKERGIILITAGHSQQTVGFENWVRVRKRGQRFGGQTVLRKVLTCD
jgi:hypothetical protein